MKNKIPLEKKRGRPFDPSKVGFVVSTAKKLFSENGFERTSIDAIAKESGVTKKTIYSHFNSKEEDEGDVEGKPRMVDVDEVAGRKLRL